MFGFLGPNGAGKSTTIMCLLDLARPTAGKVTILGLDCHVDSLAIRRRVGYLPGDLALYPKLTGREQVDYFANLRGGVDNAAIESLAERFDADLSRRTSEYSSGNRQKVGLIQAFMHHPDVVILDEPSTGLDPLVQQAFHEVVLEVRNAGRTVFLSSYTLSEVDRVADRLGIIRHGRLVEVARIEDLKAKAVRRVDLEFADDTDLASLRGVPGIRDVTGDGRFVTVRYKGTIDRVLGALSGDTGSSTRRHATPTWRKSSSSTTGTTDPTMSSALRAATLLVQPVRGSDMFRYPSAIQAKTFRENLPLAAIAGTALAVLSFFTIWIVSTMDTSGNILNNLPAAFDGIIGAGDDGTNYGLTKMAGLIAPIVVLVVAIAGGVAVLAGEEHQRTAQLLLAQPVSRREIVLAKTGVLCTHLAVPVVLFLLAPYGTEAIGAAESGYWNLTAFAIHLYALGLAFAMIAMAVGNFTGSEIVAKGAAASLAVVANLIAGVVPLVHGLEWM